MVSHKLHSHFIYHSQLTSIINFRAGPSGIGWLWLGLTVSRETTFEYEIPKTQTFQVDEKFPRRSTCLNTIFQLYRINGFFIELHVEQIGIKNA